MRKHRNAVAVLVLALAMVLMLVPGVIPTAEAAGDVAINATNFPDETFRNYVKDNFDTDGNGKLSASEIAAVTYIDVYGRYNEDGQITSLKGIEFFSALLSLECSYNQLTALDVSKNTALKNLWCYNNQLTALDVSNNTALEKLWCSDNQLMVLDVSKNMSLTSLDCSSNQLTALDVSNNILLEDLCCYNDQLTALDVSNNISLKRLYCGDNQLTALDVSKNTELEYLSCNGNQLTTLDVSMNTLLVELTCDDNQLTALDVSENISLKRLYCYGNGISILDISNCPNLVDAYVNGTKQEWVFDDVPCWIFEKSPFCLWMDPSTTAVIVASGPSITTQPKNISAAVGDTAKFAVKATGTGLTYQWQYYTGSKWANSGMTGNKTATLSVPVTAARNGQKYRCVITDGYGTKMTSDAAKLTVKIAITKQPNNITAPIGETAVFKVAATGAGLTYQWQYKAPGGTWKNTTLTGNRTATLSVKVTAGRNGYQYRCVITDANGNKTYSNAAKLTVKATITKQPNNITAPIGETAVFKVAATGAGLTYQWQYKAPGSDKWVNSGLTGNKTASLKVSVTAARNGQKYRCVITDANGNKTYSNAATLTVK